MIVPVRLFAVARQAVGQDSVEVDLPAGATIGQLRSRMAIEMPQLAGMIGQMTFAIDARYAPDAAVIPPEAEIACIPPVSGG
jgi:sulfur-carrier protein